MTITYQGHASFKLKGKTGVLVTDPYADQVGFSFPRVSADVVTVSHSHQDHNAVNKVEATSRRDKPFVIDTLGEYEVGGISVFGVETYHDATEGAERGINFCFTILIDDIRVCHLGDLGHQLNSKLVSQIGAVDVLLCPVGGVYTIDPKKAVSVIKALEPSIVIPMHYRTPAHDSEMFGELSTVDDFLKEMGVEAKTEDKLQLEKIRLPEETEVIVLQRS